MINYTLVFLHIKKISLVDRVRNKYKLILLIYNLK